MIPFKDELFRLNLPMGRYALFGSALLSIYNIRAAKDLDVIVKGELWDNLIEKHAAQLKENPVRIHIGNVEIFMDWMILTERIDERIQEKFAVAVVRQHDILCVVAFDDVEPPVVIDVRELHVRSLIPGVIACASGELARIQSGVSEDPVRGVVVGGENIQIAVVVDVSEIHGIIIISF